MNKEIVFEVRYFLISFFSGFFLILVYDIFRILRRIIKHNAFVIALEDICYWAFSAIFIFSIMYRYNNGIIRAFSILGIVLGMIIYQYIFSNVVIWTVTKLIRLLLAPFMYLCKLIRKILKFIMARVKKILKFLMKYLKKLQHWYIIKRDAKNKKRKQIKDKKREIKLEKLEKKQKEKEAIKNAQNKTDVKIKHEAIKHRDNIERISEQELHTIVKEKYIK